MSFVLDASVILAWLLPDERSDVAHSLIRGALDEGLRAPSMVLVEVGNALVQAHRRGRIRQSVRDELLAASTSLPIALEPIEAEAMLRAVELATRHALTLYDASYLELALTRRCPLATLDRALAAAARGENVPILGAPDASAP
ncbi:MAG: type II toxin-antitoxin system VapC family toxin [Casimicrobiaceae bacterium]